MNSVDSVNSVNPVNPANHSGSVSYNPDPLANKPIAKVLGIILIIAAVLVFLLDVIITPVSYALASTIEPGLIYIINLIFESFRLISPVLLLVVAIIMFVQAKKRKIAGIPSKWCLFSAIALILASLAELGSFTLGATSTIGLFVLQGSNASSYMEFSSVLSVLSILTFGVAIVLATAAAVMQLLAFLKASKEARSVAKFLIISLVGLVGILFSFIYYLIYNVFLMELLYQAFNSPPVAITIVTGIIWGLLTLVFYIGTGLSLIVKPQKG
jgi:hypothetical protein